MPGSRVLHRPAILHLAKAVASTSACQALFVQSQSISVAGKESTGPPLGGGGGGQQYHMPMLLEGFNTAKTRLMQQTQSYALDCIGGLHSPS